MLLSASCSPAFSIKASGHGANVELALQGRGTVCLYELRIGEERWPNRRTVEPVWVIKAVDGCVELRRIKIGQVPPGFAVEINRLPMRRGHMYGAHGVARFGEGGQYRGATLPWFICRGRISTVNWKDDYRLKDRPQSCLL